MADSDETLKQPLNPKRKQDASSSSEIHEEDGDRTHQETQGDDGTPPAAVEPQQQHGLVKRFKDFLLTSLGSSNTPSQTASELPVTLAGIEQPPQESGFKKWLKSLAQKVRLSRAIAADDDEEAEIAGEGFTARHSNCPYRNELRGYRHIRQGIRTAILNLVGISDNANSATITIVVVLLGFIYTVDYFVQGYGANLAFACFCFGISFISTAIACVLAFAAIPPIVRSIEDLGVEDEYLHDDVEQLRRGTVGLPFEGQTYFRETVGSLMGERVMPSRLVLRRILIVILFVFAVASSAATIFGQYLEAAGSSAPGLGPASSPPH